MVLPHRAQRVPQTTAEAEPLATAMMMMPCHGSHGNSSLLIGTHLKVLVRPLFVVETKDEKLPLMLGHESARIHLATDAEQRRDGGCCATMPLMGCRR